MRIARLIFLTLPYAYVSCPGPHNELPSYIKKIKKKLSLSVGVDQRWSKKQLPLVGTQITISPRRHVSVSFWEQQTGQKTGAG